MDLNTEFKLEIYKCKEVKTPSKAWEAAGWDFYIPENLSIFDFVKDPKTYLDDSIVHDKNIPYEVPLVFYLKSPRTVGEFPAKLVLSWNKNLNKYVFNICEKKNNEFSMISFEEVEHEIMKWLTEKTTVISRIEMQSLSKVLIPSGIHAKLPENVFLKAENKSGIASKRSLIVGACVTGETLIETNKGKFKAEDLTKEFCNNNNILIKTYNEVTKTFMYKKCDGFRCTGYEECIKVTFDDNSEIEGSYDHCICNDGKWVSLEKINENGLV